MINSRFSEDNDISTLETWRPDWHLEATEGASLFRPRQRHVSGMLSGRSTNWNTLRRWTIGGAVLTISSEALAPLLFDMWGAGTEEDSHRILLLARYCKHLRALMTYELYLVHEKPMDLGVVKPAMSKEILEDWLLGPQTHSLSYLSFSLFFIYIPKFKEVKKYASQMVAFNWV